MQTGLFWKKSCQKAGSSSVEAALKDILFWRKKDVLKRALANPGPAALGNKRDDKSDAGGMILVCAEEASLTTV